MLLGFDAVVKLRAASASDGVFGSEDSLEYRTEQTCSGKCHDKVDPDHPKPRVVRDIQCHLTAFPTKASRPAHGATETAPSAVERRFNLSLDRRHLVIRYEDSNDLEQLRPARTRKR